MIKIERLSKSYRQGFRSKVIAVDNISLEVKRNSVFGLIGPNGAGKSTVILLMLNFLKPDSGTIHIDNSSNTKYLRNHHIGYLPEIIRNFPFLNIWEYMKFNAQLSGISPNRIDCEIDKLLASVDMLDHANRRIGKLSKGMMKRVHFAQLMLGSPEMIILDEPTTGIDPISVQQLRNAVLELRDTTTFFISSHNLSELEKTCDTIGVMLNGKIMEIIDLKAIKDESHIYTIHTTGKIEALVTEKLKQSNLDFVSLENYSVSFKKTTNDDLNRLLQILINENVNIDEVRFERQSLEDKFNEIIIKTKT